METQPQADRAKLVAITALLTALVLGLGMYLGATLFGERADTPPTSAVPAVSPPTARAEPDVLGAAPPSEVVLARLTALEKSNAELRTSQTSLAERLRPALEELEKLQGEGLSPDALATALPTRIEMESDEGHVSNIARTLGLDTARREAMATEFAHVLADLETLEKAHAEVTQDGAVTTIKIGKLGDEGSRTVQRWRDWVERNLTPQEKEAYERDHDESKLLGLRGGSSSGPSRSTRRGG